MQNLLQPNEPGSGHSLLLLDLHGEAFHVSVFKVEAEVLPAEAQVGRHAVRRQSRGLGGEDEKRD